MKGKMRPTDEDVLKVARATHAILHDWLMAHDEDYAADWTVLGLDTEPASPTPTDTVTTQVWPLPPNLRVPRLAADVEATDERSTGQDSTGAYYEDFYNGLPVQRDYQGYFVIEEGKEYATYLNPPGASIEHRIVPRPGSQSNAENVT